MIDVKTITLKWYVIRMVNSSTSYALHKTVTSDQSAVSNVFLKFINTKN